MLNRLRGRMRKRERLRVLIERWWIMRTVCHFQGIGVRLPGLRLRARSMVWGDQLQVRKGRVSGDGSAASTSTMGTRRLHAQIGGIWPNSLGSLRGARIVELRGIAVATAPDPWGLLCLKELWLIGKFEVFQVCNYACSS